MLAHVPEQLCKRQRHHYPQTGCRLALSCKACRLAQDQHYGMTKRLAEHLQGAGMSIQTNLHKDHPGHMRQACHRLLQTGLYSHDDVPTQRQPRHHQNHLQGSSHGYHWGRAGHLVVRLRSLWWHRHIHQGNHHNRIWNDHALHHLWWCRRLGLH